ncbi:MAG: hypothetical protein WC249_00130 [Patescibacteria group bacterium]|jgi:cbb3-type cytochrome oxidase subunit 3
MKKIIYFISILSFLIFIPVFSVSAQEGLGDSFGSTLSTAANSSGYKNIDGGNNITAISSTVISVILSLLGTIFIALIVYGGIVWMLAEGNEQRVEKAGNIIRRAIIGLIIVIAAYAISYTLLHTLAGQLKKS